MRFTPKQREFLETIQKIGIDKLIPTTAVYDLVDEPDINVHIKEADLNGWPIAFVKNWLNDFLFDDKYDELSNDKLVLNALRIYYINYMRKK